ncbi:hypothetical protein SK128_007585 [Halocaridina rubra]|uniref:Uncharacterized protein n=1 Tax=Halocaridina rubra TaxID=373956 RepID=A0AAN8XLY0_HALRR
MLTITDKAENKKYRTERARLIDERNTNYSKIRALYAQEEEIKKAMSEIREVIGDNKKSLDQLRQLKPTLEKNWLQEQPKQVVRSKRFEEKRKQRPEQLRIREHQETRRKSWGKYEVSKDPYEEECDVCRVLISYLQSSMNLATPTSRISSPLDCRLTPSENPSTPASDPDYMGSFYMKPKDDDGFIRVSKKEKARTKRELRLARRVKELSHTPDVLLKFSKVSVAPPRNTDEIPAAVIALQDALQHFNNLYMQAKKTTAREQNVRAIAGNIRYSRPSTLALSPPQLIVTEDASALPIGTPAFLQIETPVTSKCEQKIENPSLREKVDLGNPTSPCMDLGNPISPHVDLGNPASPRMDLGNPALPRNPSLENPSQPTKLGSEVDELFTHQHCTQLAQNASVSKPAKTWATAVAINKCTNPEATTLAVVVVKKEGGGDIVLRNGFHSTEAVNEVPVFNVKPFSNADLKNCKGKLSLSSDNSFFTSPVSLTTNLVEVNNNNNTVSPSYASVTAKLSAATVQES